MSRRQKKTLWRIIIAVALWFAAIFAPLDGVWKLAAFLVPYAVIGYDVLFGALSGKLVASELRAKPLSTAFDASAKAGFRWEYYG
jgi:hypothetical protein